MAASKPTSRLSTSSHWILFSIWSGFRGLNLGIGCSHCGHGAYPHAPVSRGFWRLHIPSLKAGRGFYSTVTTIRAVPCRPPRPRLDCGPIRGEPAISGLDGSFATRPRSGQRIAHQYACGPPRAFRPASTCPGLARPLSGHILGTSGGLAPRPCSPEGVCGHVAFAMPSWFNHLGSPQRCTRRPVFRDGTDDPGPLLSAHLLLGDPSRRLFPFRPSTSITMRFHGLFTPLTRDFSPFLHSTSALSVSGCI